MTELWQYILSILVEAKPLIGIIIVLLLFKVLMWVMDI